MTNMDKSDSSPQIKLAAPGAGLPVVQAFFLRYVLFPAFCMVTSWEHAIKRFLIEGDKLIALAQSIPPEYLITPVLVRAPMGIEDSSRNWSAAMVLEHLIEVGTRISTGVVELSQNRPVTVEADIADVKPKGVNNDDMISGYRTFLNDYQDSVLNQAEDRFSKNTSNHPWFGELNPHQWVCLAAVHQRIHRRQMERIVSGLMRNTSGDV